MANQVCNDEPEPITYTFIIRNLGENEKCVKWCMDEGLIANKYECPKCKNDMNLCGRKDVNDGMAWRCGRSVHGDVRRSIRKYGWFSKSHLSMFEVLMVTHMWCMNMTNEQIMNEVHVSSHTVTDWKSFCREVCFDACERESEMLGGPGVIVEVDESKFGKRKFHRGKHVDGRWVFGGVERGSRKCFMHVVKKRDKETLVNVLRAYVKPGSIIYSDCWKGYEGVAAAGYEHHTVNHSQHFADPETGVHTNAIEGTWSAAKRHMRSGNVVTKNFDHHLAEYIWRRKYKGHKDLTRVFLNYIKILYPPVTKDKEE